MTPSNQIAKGKRNNPKAQIAAAKKQAAEDIKIKFIRHCVKNGLPEPEAEFKFDAKRKWRIDYFFINYTSQIVHLRNRVALEIEGGAYSQGRHTRGSGFIADMEKYNEIAIAGIRLIRIQPKDLFSPKTINLLRRAIGE